MKIGPCSSRTSNQRTLCNEAYCVRFHRCFPGATSLPQTNVVVLMQPAIITNLPACLESSESGHPLTNETRTESKKQHFIRDRLQFVRARFAFQFRSNAIYAHTHTHTHTLPSAGNWMCLLPKPNTNQWHWALARSYTNISKNTSEASVSSTCTLCPNVPFADGKQANKRTIRADDDDDDDGRIYITASHAAITGSQYRSVSGGVRGRNTK